MLSIVTMHAKVHPESSRQRVPILRRMFFLLKAAGLREDGYHKVDTRGPARGYQRKVAEGEFELSAVELRVQSSIAMVVTFYYFECILMKLICFIINNGCEVAICTTAF
jgi:hypothetical protein